MKKIDHVPELVRQLYGLVSQLESIADGRKFTPDGHLVGSIGELYASYQFGVILTRASTKGHDALINGKKVEIKTTQSTKVSFRHDDHEHILVYQIQKDGGVRLIFNGPGALITNSLGARNSSGQRSISLKKLEHLAEISADRFQLKEIRKLPKSR